MVPLDADKYFANADLSTKQPYITFLKKGGFKAFPNVILVRIDCVNIFEIDLINNSFEASIDILINKYDQGKGIKFKTHMRNALADDLIHMDNQITLGEEKGITKKWKRKKIALREQFSFSELS